MTLTSENDRRKVNEMLNQIQHGASHSANQTDLWIAKHPAETIGEPLIVMKSKSPIGYEQTPHAAENDLREKWVPLTNDGCGDAEWSPGGLRGGKQNHEY
jgi:hypothetical protein